MIMRFALIGIGLMISMSPAYADARLEGIQAMQEKLQALTEPLNETQRSHFMMIYNNHNLLNVVDTIEGDVERAVKACGENNPSIKQKMSSRFVDWQAALYPVRAEARAHLDNMILVQDYAPSADILEILDLANAVRIATNNQFKKVPVTDLDGCNYLHAKMSDTQDNLTRLLRSTMISLPVQAQQDQRDQTP